MNTPNQAWFAATRVRIATVFLTTMVVAGCSGSSPDTPDAADAGSTAVEVVNISYAPETLEIETGAEVVWTNMDEGVHHTVTSGSPGDNGVPGVSKGEPAKPDGVFDGDLPDASSTFSFTFDEVGTFDYFCNVHPSMTGKIIVR